MADAQTELGDEAFTELWKQGSEMGLQEAIADAVAREKAGDE